MARVLAVCVSGRKGEKKRPVGEIQLKTDYGVTGDAHAGPGRRQVSLLANESVDALRARGLTPRAGDFAENILTEGVALRTLPVGTRLRVGSALLEITQIGKECHSGCAIKEQAGVCVMPTEGVFAAVREDGVIKANDGIEVIA